MALIAWIFLEQVWLTARRGELAQASLCVGVASRHIDKRIGQGGFKAIVGIYDLVQHRALTVVKRERENDAGCGELCILKQRDCQLHKEKAGGDENDEFWGGEQRPH
jgi:hypothetical protein